jgi:putative DNA primase/helicase
MIDFEGVNAAALSVFPKLVADWLPAGRLHGREWVLGDLSGTAGRSLSVNVHSGKWSDFSAGLKGGDPISLYAAIKYHGNRIEAARELGKMLGISDTGSNAAQTTAAPHVSAPVIPDWRPIDSRNAPEPKAILAKWDHVYRYNRADGSTIGYVLRKDKPKKIVPLNFGEKIDGDGVCVTGWTYKHLMSPRPLYGMDRLAERPDAPVLICEGEKAADAAIALLPDYIPVTWQAGTGNVNNVDWTPLAGRNCVIWPDADVPGYFAAAEILRALPEAHCLDVIEEPEGSDAADLQVGDPADWIGAHMAPPAHILDTVAALIAGGYGAKLKKEGPLPSREWLAEHAPVTQDDQPPPWEPGYEADPSEPYIEPEAAVDAPQNTAAADIIDDGEHIIPLGLDRGIYYYLSTATGQIEPVQAHGHTRAMLTHLASEAYYWQRTRFINKAGVDWNAAADDLRMRCRAVDIFDPDRVRGRGAWLDKGRSVLHLGNRCIVNGVEGSRIVPESGYCYEKTPTMDIQLGDPLGDAEANAFRSLCASLSWEEPEHMGNMLAGWCVIAPVCGAMPWRPHLWLSGESGSGKSWALDNLIKPVIGSIAFEVQSKTTEAGIRQTLGCDARPVIFDEAETQNDRDTERVQLVLDLARQASNEDGAAIVKGSSSGKAMQYRIRSCFLFSAINNGVTQTADENRMVQLTLTVETDMAKRAEAFVKLKEQHARCMAPGFPGRLLARTLALLPVIRENAEIFACAIARAGNSRRMGDTCGVILAGAWSLRSSGVISVSEADRVVRETRWVKEAVAKVEAEADWQKAMSHLMQHRTRVRGEDVPVGELIRICVTGQSDGSMSFTDAERELHRMGMKAELDYNGNHELLMATKSTSGDEIFRKTPWANSWGKTLSRMPGARKNVGFMWLAGRSTRVRAFPLLDM